MSTPVTDLTIRDLYSIPAAAATLSVSRSTIYKEMYANRLRSIKVGQRRLIPREAIEDWLQAKAAEPQEALHG